MSISIPEIDSWECPVSAITPESFDLVQIVNDAQNMKEFMGATLYGADSADWDQRHYDAVRVIAQEDARAQNAVDKALA